MIFFLIQDCENVFSPWDIHVYVPINAYKCTFTELFSIEFKVDSERVKKQAKAIFYLSIKRRVI